MRQPGYFLLYLMARLLMPDIPFSELNANLSTNTGDALTNIANTAANFYCDLYAADPLGVTGGLIRTPAGTAINALNTRLCSPRAKNPPPPALPFSGGQCEIEYSFDTSFGSTDPERPGNPTIPIIGTASYSLVPGPVLGTAIRLNAGGQGKRGVVLVKPSPLYPDGELVVWISSDSVLERYEGAYVRISNVQPSNASLPDNCGNPAPTYEPVVAPVINFSAPVSVNFGVTGNLVVPVTVVPVRIAPNINIRPEIKVDVGGIEVSFSPDGVTFNFGDNNNTTNISPSPGTDPRTNPPAPRPPSGGGGGSVQCPDPCPDPCDDTAVLEKLGDLEELLEDIKDCACEKTYEEQVFNTQPVNNERRGLPPRTKSVCIKVTKIGDRISGEWGGGSAPNVEYLGWYAWRIDGLESDRHPISYEFSCYQAPERATGFSYTLRNNSLAFLTVLHEVEVVPS